MPPKPKAPPTPKMSVATEDQYKANIAELQQKLDLVTRKYADVQNTANGILMQLRGICQSFQGGGQQ